MRIDAEKAREDDESADGPVYETELVIRNPSGLHMRPAMQFVDIVNRYGCDVKVSNGDSCVDAKSIMQMSMLAATYGTKLKVTAQGPGAEELIGVLRELVEEKMFDESSPSGDQTDRSLSEGQNGN